jgi:hypothetical protein
MKSYFQALIVLILAVPFLYMAYDVSREIIRKSVTIYWRKAKAILISLLTPIKTW